MTREVDPLLERIDQVLAAEFALASEPAPAIVSTSPESANAVLDEWERRLDELPTPLLSEIKLTADEWEAVKARFPERPPDPYGRVLGDPFGIPVRLVEDPKESTLYRPPPSSLVFLLAEAGEPADACGGVIEGHVLVAEPDPVEVVLPADREPSTVEYVGFDEPPRVIVELPPDPMRGWLRQLLGRWFG